MRETREQEQGEGTRWRKRPVVIEAVQWTGGNLVDVIAFTDGRHPDTRGNHAGMKWEEYRDLVARDGLKIFTLEGTMRADVGDWIIRGVKGECYPCKPDIFAATYEPATPAPVAEPSGTAQGAGVEGRSAATGRHLDGATEIRLGDDPFGRDERTVFYRHPKHGQCYVWERHLNDADRAAVSAALTPPADAGGAVGHKAAQLQRDVGELVASLQIRQDAGEYVQREWEALRRLERIATGSLSLAARAREAEGLRAELRQARADYWEVQAALSEIKCLVPLDESTDGPKAGWAGVVERVRCFTQRAEREAADLRARCERLEADDSAPVREAAERYDAIAEREHATAAEARDAIWRAMHLRCVADWMDELHAAVNPQARAAEPAGEATHGE